MAHALLDARWPAVRQLVRVLCACPLPVTLPGPVVTRLILAGPRRHDLLRARPRVYTLTARHLAVGGG